MNVGEWKEYEKTILGRMGEKKGGWLSHLAYGGFGVSQTDTTFFF